MSRTYLRPTAFVDAPFGLDGQVARLAGGLLWFSAVEWITAESGRRSRTELVPVAALETLLARDGEAAASWKNMVSPRPRLQLGARQVPLDQPQVVGIVNATPDSFSDGGRFDTPEAAAAAGGAMAGAGAAIVDVGGESTRPGARMVWEGDEIARVLPIVQRLAASGTAVSIDTRKGAVASHMVAAGATMINDVSGGTFADSTLPVAARTGAALVITHHQGTPETMQREPNYGDVLLDVYDWLSARVDAAVAAGVERSRIVVDPGIGFGKTVAHNLQLLNGLSLLHGLGCPLMLGASRKRMIGALAGEAAAEERLPGSLALALQGAAQGVQLVRVHDVPETVQALKLWRGLRDQALTPSF